MNKENLELLGLNKNLDGNSELTTLALFSKLFPMPAGHYYAE